MRLRSNIFWAFAVALLASAALNGCALENLPLSNTASGSRMDRPLPGCHHTPR